MPQRTIPTLQVPLPYFKEYYYIHVTNRSEFVDLLPNYNKKRIPVFLQITSCRLVNGYRRFDRSDSKKSDSDCPIKMKALRSFKSSVKSLPVDTVSHSSGLDLSNTHVKTPNLVLLKTK